MFLHLPYFCKRRYSSRELHFSGAMLDSKDDISTLQKQLQQRRFSVFVVVLLLLLLIIIFFFFFVLLFLFFFSFMKLMKTQPFFFCIQLLLLLWYYYNRRPAFGYHLRLQYEDNQFCGSTARYTFTPLWHLFVFPTPRETAKLYSFIHKNTVKRGIV